MSSDNPTGADNQQERPGSSDWLDAIPLDVGHYVAGFVDGEGSFNVPIRRERDRGQPWRVSLSFNVSQVGPEAPAFLRSVFGAGTTRGRGDGVWYFEVTRPTELEARVFPSSTGSRFAARRLSISRSFARSRRSFGQAATAPPKVSNVSSS